ncbi:uncharacterized protein LOC119656983 [Hermetia illucens]|uniref:uncharacterized protein LOC119656983 n=1 Tax=Hermetia illucens TaxID=343691 RepID=UPI0018CC73AD|nr:uncharacterized protein LOC119656983 [Hermetia illucens]
MKSPIFILEDSSRPHKENNVPTKSVHTFDEAVTECGVGKFHYFTFVACGFCFVEIVLAIYSTQLYIMFTKCDLQITIHEEGIVTSATLMGIIASSHAWGFISDKWGRIKVIRISIPGTVIFIILSALASTTPMLITCRFLVGVLIGGCQASVFSYFGEFFNSEVRPRSVARTSMFFAFGSLLAPVLAITFLPFKFDWTIYGYPFSSWRLVEMTCALPGICVLVVLPYMPESPKFLLSKGDNEGSLKVLRYIYFINTGKSREEYPVEKLYEDDDNLKESDVPSNPLSLLWNQTIQMFLKSRLWVSLNLLSNFFFSYAVWNGLHAWYPEILTLTSKLRETGMTVCEIIQNELKTTPNMTGPSHSHLGCATEIDNTIYHVVIVIGLVNAVVYMISGYVVKLFRKKHLIAFWLLFSGLSTVLITWCRNFYLTNFLFLNVNMIAVNAGLVIAIAVSFYPTSISATAVCLIMMFGSLGQVVGVNIIGFFLPRNCEFIFYGSGTFLCCLALLSFLLPSDQSERNGSIDHSIPKNSTSGKSHVSTKSVHTFDEAVTECGVGKFHYFTFVVCGLCLMEIVLAIYSTQLYIMFTKCDLQITMHEEGIVTSATLMGIIASSHAWGFISDKWGRIKVIRISIPGTVIFIILSALASTTPMLITCRFLVGVLIGGCQASVFSYFGEFFNSEIRPRSVARTSMFFALGSLLAPVLSITFLPFKFDWTIYGHPFSSWRLVEMTCALPGICVLVVLPFMPESPKFLLSKGDNEGSLKVLRYIYYINTGKSKDEYPVEKLYEDSANLKESDEPRNPFLLLWNQTIQMFLKSRVWVSLNLLTNIFVSYAVWNGLHAWYPEILTLTSKLRETGMTVCEIVQNELKTTPNMTGPPHGDLGCATKIDNTIYHVVIVIGLVNAVVYMISGYVVKLFRKKHLIAFWLLFSGLSTVLITWCRHFYLTNFLFLNVNMIAVNVGLIVAIAVSYFPTSISATTVCLTMMSGRIGQVVGVNVIGFILPRNCELIFYGSGTVLCCFALLSLLLPSDQSERNGSVDHSIPKSSTSGSNSDINPVNTVKV